MPRWSVAPLTRPTAIALVLGLGLGVGLGACVADHDVVQAPATSPTAMPTGLHEACPELVAMLEWGIARFDAAGLDLPDIASIRFDDDGERCDTADGWAVLSSEGYELSFCFEDPPPRSDDAAVRHAIVHELAHTWLHANLDGAERQRFLDHTGLATWNDLDVPWSRRGVERAAEALSWLVLDDPDAMLTLDADRDLLAGDAELLVTMADAPRHP